MGEHAAEGFVAEVEQVFAGSMDEPRHTPAKDALVEEPVVKDAPIEQPIVKEAPEEWQGAREEPLVEEVTEEPVELQLTESAEVVTHQPKISNSDFSARISWQKMAAVARLAVRRTMTEASISAVNDGQQKQKLGLALVLQGICCQVVGVSEDGAAALWNAEHSKTPLISGATQIWVVNNVKGDAAAIRDELQRATAWNIKFTTCSTVHIEGVEDMDSVSVDGTSFVVLDSDS